MRRLANAWKALFGDKGATSSAGGLLAGVLSTTQAPRRGTRELLLAYKRLPYLHSLLCRIAEDTAAIPWQVFAPTSNRGKSALRQARQLGMAGPVGQARLRKAMEAGDLREVEGHPFLGVLESMNPALGGHDSWVLAQLYLDLVGQAPLVRQNNQMGLPLELWPVSPHWIVEYPSVNSPYYRASWGTWQRLIPEEEMVWLRAPDPEMPYGRGTGIGEALADALDIAEMREKYMKNYFFRDATPAALISADGISPDDAHRLVESLTAKHGGPKKGGIHVVPRSMQYQQLEQKWADLQMSELRREDREVVQQVLQFPPELMGVLENSNRSTIDAAYLLYARGALVPRKERQRAAMQALLAEYDERLVLGYVSPVPEDEAAQRAHMVAVPAAFKWNEHRAKGGQPPLEGEEGEALFTPPAVAPTPFGLSVGRGDPPWAKALPPRTVTRTVQEALESLRPERLAEEVGPVQEEGVREWAEAALRELGISGSFDMRNPRVRQFLEEAAGTRIRLINETTLQALREELAAGVAAGEGINQLRKRVEDVFEAAEGYRATRIARTEVVGLSNAANLEAWRQSGVVSGKEWLAVRDSATRDSHRALDGQKVGLDSMFTTPSGRQAQHPGGFGIAEEDVQCRCVALPMVSEKAMDEEQKTARWKAYDEALLPWERRLERAFQRGFRAQRAAVLAALGT